MNGAPQDDSEDEHVRCLIKLGVRRSRSCRDRVRRTSTSDPGQPGGGGLAEEREDPAVQHRGGLTPARRCSSCVCIAAFP